MLDESMAAADALRDQGIGAIESMEGFDTEDGSTAMETLHAFHRELHASLEHEYILQATLASTEQQRDQAVEERNAALARHAAAVEERDEARKERDAARRTVKRITDWAVRNQIGLPDVD